MLTLKIIIKYIFFQHIFPGGNCEGLAVFAGGISLFGAKRLWCGWRSNQLGSSNLWLSFLTRQIVSKTSESDNRRFKLPYWFDVQPRLSAAELKMSPEIQIGPLRAIKYFLVTWKLSWLSQAGFQLAMKVQIHNYWATTDLISSSFFPQTRMSTGRLARHPQHQHHAYLVWKNGVQFLKTNNDVKFCRPIIHSLVKFSTWKFYN